MVGVLRRCLGALGLAAAILAAGCGGGVSLGEVEGTVRLDGGDPLGNVVVEFLPDPEKGTVGPRSTAVADEKGHYTLRCDNQQAGAVIGWHRVIVQDIESERPRQGQQPKSSPRVPGSYAVAGTTPLRHQVNAGKQVINLDVKGP